MSFDFENQPCPECGVRFGVPVGFTENRRKDKRSFYCPNGHSMSYTESVEEKLRRERNRLKQDQARLEQELADARAETERKEKAVKRLKKRASAGTCPCCKRTFKNMAEHMKHQHPEFVAGEGAKVIPIKRGAK